MHRKLTDWLLEGGENERHSTERNRESSHGRSKSVLFESGKREEIPRMEEEERMRKEKIEETLFTIWYYIRLIFVLMFAMAAGAACYHQYIMLHTPQMTEQKVVYRYIENNYTAEPVIYLQELEVYEPTPEELEEEYYFDSLELLACCVEAEAGNQDLLGKRMVASVILNRVDDEDWPDSIVEVITQPYQFTTWWNGAIEKAEPSEETFEAVRLELEERSYPGLFYFCSTGYSEYGTPWGKVGDHYFSTK